MDEITTASERATPDMAPSNFRKLGDELNQCLQIILTNAGNWKDDDPLRHEYYETIDAAVDRAAKAIRKLAALRAEPTEPVSEAPELRAIIHETLRQCAVTHATGYTMYEAVTLESVLVALASRKGGGQP